jgi:hypothetical protein
MVQAISGEGNASPYEIKCKSADAAKGSNYRRLPEKKEQSSSKWSRLAIK